MWRENNERSSYRPQFRAPVTVGEEIDVKIEAIGEKGDGVAKKNGYVLFVPGVQLGEEIRIKVTKTLKNVGFAEKVGAAQGPIQESQPPRKREEHQQQEPRQEETEEYTQAEDSENFGEEAEEQKEDETETQETDKY